MEGAQSPRLLLDVRDISYSIAGVELFGSANIGLRSGEMLCLVGANGAGKTILLEILAGVREPGSGSIHIAPPDSLRASTLLVSIDQIQSRHGLTPHAFVADLGGGSSDADRRALDRVGLSVERPMATLSWGEQIRVALCSALASDAAVVLLDSPTMGVDSAGFDFVESAIAELLQQGRSVISATTDPELVQRSSQALLATLVGGSVVPLP